MSPLAHLRRTPLRRLLESERANWRDLTDTAIAVTPHDAEQARRLAIVDLSPLPRLGFKGRGTIEAMKKRGVSVESSPNRAFRQANGGLCLVLAPGEVLLLSNFAGDGGQFEEMLAAWRLDDEERTYPVPRRDSHGWFAITGVEAPDMFAKVCAIDLRREKFPDLAIAQTSVAKISAIVVRADSGDNPLYHVLADSAAALYFSSCLLDAACEFGGRLLGLEAVQSVGA